MYQAVLTRLWRPSKEPTRNIGSYLLPGRSSKRVRFRLNCFSNVSTRKRYSRRSVFTGSTSVARNAGIRLAASPTATSVPQTRRNVAGSAALTSKSIFVIARDIAAEARRERITVGDSFAIGREIRAHAEQFAGAANSRDCGQPAAGGWGVRTSYLGDPPRSS